MKNLKFFCTYHGPDTELGTSTYTLELNPHNSEVLGNGKKGSDRLNNLMMIVLTHHRNNWLKNHYVPQTVLAAEDEWVNTEVNHLNLKLGSILDSSIVLPISYSFYLHSVPQLCPPLLPGWPCLGSGRWDLISGPCGNVPPGPHASKLPTTTAAKMVFLNCKSDPITLLLKT